ncbi:lymphocyte antigen 6K [Choloepus didactylus]|uniref:lymphocyte antigen 6K n=1 Tax=Choloepus didactylus TaxID=27675 RepID=UPI0018A0B6C7|nr:lymphocyte antigen 6K [Choloepus didactylus]
MPMSEKEEGPEVPTTHAVKEKELEEGEAVRVRGRGLGTAPRRSAESREMKEGTRRAQRRPRPPTTATGARKPARPSPEEAEAAQGGRGGAGSAPVGGAASEHSGRSRGEAGQGQRLRREARPARGEKSRRRRLPRVQRPLASMLFLTLLLAMALPGGETNVSISERQDPLRCHACEEENGFACVNPVDCETQQRYCTIAAIKFYPRFFLVSKQCAQYCSVIARPTEAAKSFLLEKPLPFLYGMCCSSPLCNQNGPEMNKSTFREFAGRAAEHRDSRTGALLLALAAAGGLGLL